MYRVADDPGEHNDLSRKMPEVARVLREQLAAWRAEVNAAMPQPNPYYEDMLADRLPCPDSHGRWPPGWDLPGSGVSGRR